MSDYPCFFVNFRIVRIIIYIIVIFRYFLPKAFISLYLTMNFNVDFEAIGNAFVQHYYRTFDNPDPNARTAGLSDLYDPLNSYMTFEGVQVKGRQAILEKFAVIFMIFFIFFIFYFSFFFFAFFY